MDTITDVLEVSIERVLRAPRELVFDAWVEPRHLRRWSAPHGFEIPECDGEARAGGQWFAVMLSPEGTRLRLEGRYLEVVRPERLVFTHQWVEAGCAPGPETVVTVSFDGGGGRDADAVPADRLRERGVSRRARRRVEPVLRAAGGPAGGGGVRWR